VNKFQSYPDKAIFKEQVIGLLAGATTVNTSDPSQSLISFFDRQVKLNREGKRTVLKGNLGTAILGVVFAISSLQFVYLPP
jgi:hypothetical protein